jgi:hypothetical protein
MSETWSKMHISLHVKYPLFLSGFNETWIFRPDFWKIYSNIKFHENPSSRSRDVPCGRTEDTMMLIVAFRNFANAPKSHRIWKHYAATSSEIEIQGLNERQTSSALSWTDSDMTVTSRLARNMAGGPIVLSPVYKSEVPSEYHPVSVQELYRTSFMTMGWNTKTRGLSTLNTELAFRRC